MKKQMEINNLQDLIVNKLLEEYSEDDYMSLSDKEYRINDILDNIAKLLIRMVKE